MVGGVSARQFTIIIELEVNAKLPMDVTPAGIVISFRLSQERSMEFGILVTPVEMLMEERFLQ